MPANKPQAPELTDLTRALVNFCQAQNEFDLISGKRSSSERVATVFVMAKGGLALMAAYPELQEIPAPMPTGKEPFRELAQRHVVGYLVGWIQAANEWLHQSVEELDYRRPGSTLTEGYNEDYSDPDWYEKYVTYREQVWRSKAFAYVVKYATA